MKKNHPSLLFFLLVCALLLTAIPVAADDGVDTATFTLDGGKPYAAVPVEGGSVTLIPNP